MTRMCTKVYSEGEGPVTSGCYKETVDGYDVELCVCESSTGVYKPCNNGILHFPNVSLFVAVLVSLLFDYL